MRKNPSYTYIHVWNLKHWKKKGICEHCGLSCKTDWSNKTGKYRLGFREDWQELCRKCHRKYDIEVLKIKFGATKGMIKERRFKVRQKKFFELFNSIEGLL